MTCSQEKAQIVQHYNKGVLEKLEFIHRYGKTDVTLVNGDVSRLFVQRGSSRPIEVDLLFEKGRIIGSNTGLEIMGLPVSEETPCFDIKTKLGTVSIIRALMPHETGSVKMFFGKSDAEDNAALSAVVVHLIRNNSPATNATLFLAGPKAGTVEVTGPYAKDVKIQKVEDSASLKERLVRSSPRGKGPEEMSQ